jgi:hypothetical protein
LEGSIFRPFTSTEGTLPSLVPKKNKTCRMYIMKIHMQDYT